MVYVLNVDEEEELTNTPRLSMSEQADYTVSVVLLLRAEILQDMGDHSTPQPSTLGDS